MTALPVAIHDYYRQVTDVDIGEIGRELLGGPRRLPGPFQFDGEHVAQRHQQFDVERGVGQPGVRQYLFGARPRS